jgi:cytochrome P460
MQTTLITKRIAVIMLSAAGILMLGANLWAQSESQVAYPSHYRNWVHVRSALVDPNSPKAGRYGGLHHIYANEKAMEGYRTGVFPDGSVIVFDLLETRENAGTTVEGPRKFIDVMTKESKRYPDTGGWGFEEFVGDSQTDRALTSQAKSACYGCHTRRKSNDFVFSTFRK